VGFTEEKPPTVRGIILLLFENIEFTPGHFLDPKHLLGAETCEVFTREQIEQCGFESSFALDRW